MLRCPRAVGLLVALTASVLLPPPGLAEEPVDLDMITLIRDEGFHRSQVMDIATHITELIGPRLTGSPQMLEANRWTEKRLKEAGLANAHLESFEFGRGWTFEHVSVHMLAPRAQPLLALPQGWSSGTKKPIRGQAMKVKIESAKDFENYKGKLAGKVLLTSDAREVEPPDGPTFRRWSEEDLKELAQFEIPGNRPQREGWRERRRKRWELREPLKKFLEEEGALALVQVSSRDNGLIRVGGTGFLEVGEDPGVPQLVMASEHYNHVLRLLDAGKEVEIEIDLKVHFHEKENLAYNTVAEIPGTDLADQVVMVGGHLDSWHAGTGATDNGVSCAVAIEAMRILKTLGVTPRRTLRIALWSGEEQGLLGSHAYVAEHFASRPEPEDPEQKKLPRFLREETGPLEVKPEHAGLSAYFNLDNGGGKIRGIYAQESSAAAAIFRAWLAPFADLGAAQVTLNNTGSTDHVSFDRVGLPGFQFIQDGMDYSSTTHHTNMDTLDHVNEEDLKQASVILASFLYHAAMRDERMPRKPMPKDEPAKKKSDAEKEAEGDASSRR